MADKPKGRDRLRIALIIVHALFVLLLIANLAAQIKQTLAITDQNNLLRSTMLRCQIAEERAKKAEDACKGQNPPPQ